MRFHSFSCLLLSTGAMKGRQTVAPTQKRDSKPVRKLVFGMKRDSLKNIMSSSSKDEESGDSAVTDRGLLFKGVF